MCFNVPLTPLYVSNCICVGKYGNITDPLQDQKVLFQENGVTMFLANLFVAEKS